MKTIMKKFMKKRLMMKLNKNKSFVLLLLFFYLLNSHLLAASLPLSIQGEYLIRLPNSSKYIRNSLKEFPDNIIINVPNSNKSTNSVLTLDGHVIKLYPGVVFKISKGYLYPLLGRFEFDSDDNDNNSINIITNNCNASYNYGHFFIEVTPDNGVFFSLKNKGSAWVKDSSRKVFELKQGQQIQVPLFGESVVKNRVESFWGKTPSSYGNLGEMGQETAYGIVGKDNSFTPSNQIKEEKKNDEIDENDDIDERDDNEENSEFEDELEENEED